MSQQICSALQTPTICIAGGRIAALNALQCFGEMLGHSVSELGPELRELIQRAGKNAGETSCEHICLHSPTGDRAVEAQLVPLETKGDWLLICGTPCGYTYSTSADKHLDYPDAIFHITTDGIIATDPEGRIRLFNQGAQETFGYSPDEIIGKRIEVLMPERFRAGHFEHMTRFGAGAAPARMMGERGRITGLRKNGEEFPAEASITRLDIDGQNHFGIVLRDVSEVARAEERQRNSHAQLVASQRIAHLGHWVLDLVTGEMEWSEELYRILGFSPETMKPSLDHLSKVVHPSDISTFESAIAGVRAGTPFSIDHRILRPDGKTLVVFQQAEVKLDVLGKPVRVTSIVHDITERKAIEAQLREATSAAVAASKAKSDFLAQMSHELRTPLNAIIGFSEIMADECFGKIGNERYREYADHIRDSGRHLLDLINRILDLSRFEAGKLKTRDGEVSLANVIHHCVSLLSNEASRFGLALSAGNIEPINIIADELMLTQILLNLISNAIKFTPKGGKITIDAFQEDPNDPVVLRVTDTGLGIDKANIARALEPFGQVAPATNGTIRGTGLGLPLSKALAALHGGDLSIDSEPGKGTSVIVQLPAQRVIKAGCSGVSCPR